MTGITELEPIEMSGGDVRTVAELGALATKPRRLEDGATYAIPDGNGGVKFEKVDDTPEHPLIISASRTVTDAESFIDYVNRHADVNTEVWADSKRSTVVAIIDGNAAVGGGLTRPGWGGHRVSLSLEFTPSWVAWLALNKQLSSQVEFAEHIEENAIDVLEPDSATLLEIAQTFQATRGVEFGQSTRLSNGEVQIKYSETLDGKAGRKGDLTIPDEFKLGLIPYIGGAGYKLTAKLRWRLHESDLSLGYTLIKPEVVLEDAFKDVLQTIQAGITQTVFAGRP